MSKVNQIERALLEMSGDAFQNLAVAYLHSMGYYEINPIGVVPGSDKSRAGTPDTLVARPDGKYVFAQYTTQQERVHAKLKEDLEKCFDETCTGVPVSRIAEVVLCFNSGISASGEDDLRQTCQDNGVILSLFGIARIAQDLYKKYPGLARDYLNIEIDTGQILTADEFTRIYGKKSMATPVDTCFRFRDGELAQAVQLLESGSMVILTGRPGVGKTRLALEVLDRFARAHEEYTARCVFNKGPDLFQDVAAYFAPPGRYLIFVDDANRTNGLEYILDLLRDQSDEKTVRVIMTVRDYALEKVREMVKDYGDAKEIELQPLLRDQVKEILKAEFGLDDYYCLERIAEVADGNPRLAIMMAGIVRGGGSLASIADVSSVYDAYFASICHDLEDLGDPSILRTAAAVAFLGVLDRANAEAAASIERVFGVTWSQLWDAVGVLHRLEIVDVYDKDLVKSGDQILSTYLLYLVFFKQRLAKFSLVLDAFFPRMRSNIVGMLNPILNSFWSESLVAAVKNDVDQACAAAKESGDQDRLLALHKTFWYLEETETLLYIRQEIQQMDPVETGVELVWHTRRRKSSLPELLDLLGRFWQCKMDVVVLALELTAEYLCKRPDRFEEVLALLVERFGFNRYSHLSRYAVQAAVIEMLRARSAMGADIAFSKMLLAVGEKYLHTDFESMEPGRRYAMTIHRFTLPATSEILSLRKVIWNSIFAFYDCPQLSKDVVEAIRTHVSSRPEISSVEIVKHDAAFVLEFVSSKLQNNNYLHAAIVNEYLDDLENRGIQTDPKYREQFSSEVYRVSRMLLEEWGDVARRGVLFEDWQKERAETIARYVAAPAFDCREFLGMVLDVWLASDNQERYRIVDGVLCTFQATVDLNPALFKESLEYYLDLGDPLALPPDPLAGMLVRAVGLSPALDMITHTSLPSRDRWLFGFYESLQEERTTLEMADAVLSLLNTADPANLPRDLVFLLKYHSHRPSLVLEVAETLLDRGKDAIYPLASFFRVYDEAHRQLLNLLTANVSLLERAYLQVLENVDAHIDFDSRVLDRILSEDAEFISTYVRWLLGPDGPAARLTWSQDYSRLWVRDDSEMLFRRVMDEGYQGHKSGLIWHWPINSFFVPLANHSSAPEVQQRQDQFLLSIIRERACDIGFMEFLFGIVVELIPERTLQFYDEFVNQNQRFSDFERLPLDPLMVSWSGSAVPFLQKKVERYESMLPFLNNVKLLEHKLYLERLVRATNEEIEREKRRDFIDQ